MIGGPPPGAASTAVTELERDLVRYLSTVDFDAPDEAAFADLARRIFRHQFERNLPYQRFCLSRGLTPDRFTDFRQAPPVPTDVFKVVDLATFPPAEAARTFRTSGTTRGGEARGRHHFSSLEPYNAAILPAFRRHLLPDGAMLPLLSLVPPAGELPDSSLSYMVDFLMERLATPGSGHFFRGGELELEALTGALESAAAAGQPVLLLGTAFAFVHLFDERPDFSVDLPPGSRLMETGGLKGRAREVSRGELYDLFTRRLGVPLEACVAEYGMTELSSQLYDSSLRAQWLERPGPRRLMAPPWLKVLVVDPVTLEPLPEGAVGLVRFFDLANLNSVCAIQTSDRGRLSEGGLELLGRAPEAEARGCSLTAEELLRVAPGGGNGRS